VVTCPLCSGTGRYSTNAGHPLWTPFFGGEVEPSFFTCPLCDGSRQVEDKDEDILLKHPWKILELVNEVQRKNAEQRRLAKKREKSQSGEGVPD
jgi:hypothetical protein